MMIAMAMISSSSHQSSGEEERQLQTIGDEEVVNEGDEGGEKKKRRNNKNKASTSTESTTTTRKRKTRRARRCKPFHKMSIEEKKALEQREEIRAEQSRARRFAHGRPMAPYNTTQFLLNDREIRTNADWEETTRQRGISESEMMIGNGSETASGESPSDEQAEDIEFETEYNTVNAERLDALSKGELVMAMLQKEAECDVLSNENRKLKEELIEMRRRLEQLVDK